MWTRKVSPPLPPGRKSSHSVKLLEARNFNLMGYYQYSRQYTNSLVKYVGDRYPLIARGAGAFVGGISGQRKNGDRNSPVAKISWLVWCPQ